MKFYFSNKTKQKVPERYFLFILKKALKKLEIKNDFELSLILLKEKEIKELNKKYRNKNEITDVLSFPIDLAKPKDIKKINISDKIILGDIYLCPKFIIKNSKSPNEDFGFAFLHGLIHLLGYDHKNKKEEKQWQRIFRKIQS